MDVRELIEHDEGVKTMIPNTTYKKLADAGVTYTTRNVFSGFHGTRFDFPTLKDARKAEKATGYSVQGKRGSYHFILY